MTCSTNCGSPPPGPKRAERRSPGPATCPSSPRCRRMPSDSMRRTPARRSPASRPSRSPRSRRFVPIPRRAIGQPLVSVGRRGKMLLLDVGHAHLRRPPDAGRPAQAGREADARSRVAASPRWTFADGRALLLTEAGTERKAGVWAVAGDPETQEPLAELGPDADQVTEPMLAELLQAQVDAAPRLAAGPTHPRRPRAPPRQRDLPPRQALAVRHHGEARRRAPSSACSTRSASASTSRSPTSAPATT